MAKMTPKPPARRAKKGRAKTVPVKFRKGWMVSRRGPHVPFVLMRAWAARDWRSRFGYTVRPVWIVPSDGSYIVKRKEARRGKA